MFLRIKINITKKKNPDQNNFYYQLISADIKRSKETFK